VKYVPIRRPIEKQLFRKYPVRQVFGFDTVIVRFYFTDKVEKYSPIPLENLKSKLNIYDVGNRFIFLAWLRCYYYAGQLPR